MADEDAARLTAVPRRTVLGALLSLPMLAAAGCARTLGAAARRPAAPLYSGPLIDAHCHIFNNTDIPAATFIMRGKLGIRPRRKGPRFWEKSLHDWLGRIAKAERKGVLLAGEELADIMRGGTATPACQPGPEKRFEGLRGWVRSFQSRRTALLGRLVCAHQGSGAQPVLLCPALVDYSNWLGEASLSPLRDQIALMSAISKRSQGPAVHGYVPFDPLRRALYRCGLDQLDGGWDPLAEVERALTEGGFIGVKLYPAMGFKAAWNDASQHYPPVVIDKFGGAANVAREINRALEELWRLCVRLDAPIMTHALNTWGGGPGYARRADPTHWLPVFERHPKLRVLLAHFGAFSTVSADARQADRPAGGALPFEATWEAVMARYVQKHPNAPVYADISYLSEVYDREKRAHALRGMQEYLRFDPEVRHLVFGSDWLMVGYESDYDKPPGYTAEVVSFLIDAGITGEKLERVMVGNAVRFFGLRRGEATRRRLLRFRPDATLPDGRSARSMPPPGLRS